MSHSSGNLLREIASSLPDLKTLKLERVVPLLSDDDLILFSRSSTGLQSLSLLGCQQLTNGKFSLKYTCHFCFQEVLKYRC